MEQEFGNFKQSTAFKELGFNEPCLGYWDGDPQLKRPYLNLSRPLTHDWVTPAPLKQQVFRFFREKFKFFGLVEGSYDNGKNLFTYVIWRGGFDDGIDEYWHTYEEAESACIDKLIEIAKQQ